MFSPTTMDQYRDLWATHLRNEMIVERMRNDNTHTLQIQQAFESLDINKDGYIDREDVSFK